MALACSTLSTLLPTTDTDCTMYSGEVAKETAAAVRKASPTRAKKLPRRMSSLKSRQPALRFWILDFGFWISILYIHRRGAEVAEGLWGITKYELRITS